MKKKFMITVAVAVLLAGSPAFSQQNTIDVDQVTKTTPQEESVFDDYLNPSSGQTGFLRIPGLHFNSSVGFSYATSQSFGDVGMGYYMGHFSYSFGGAVTLNWDVGVGSYMMGGSGMNNYQLMIPNVDLTWRPSDNVMVKLQYMNGGYLNPYYSRRGFGF